MTCERIEELLSAYLEGELPTPERAAVETHLGSCAECASLAVLMREAMSATAGFPEAQPSAGLMARLYAIPEQAAAARSRKGRGRAALDWLGRPSLQPVYAAATGLLIVLSFALFHPEGRGLRKEIAVRFHKGVGTVEKLYAEAGSLKGEIGAFSANVLKSFNTLGLLKGDGKDQ